MTCLPLPIVTGEGHDDALDIVDLNFIPIDICYCGVKYRVDCGNITQVGPLCSNFVCFVLCFVAALWWMKISLQSARHRHKISVLVGTFPRKCEFLYRFTSIVHSRIDMIHFG